MTTLVSYTRRTPVPRTPCPPSPVCTRCLALTPTQTPANVAFFTRCSFPAPDTRPPPVLKPAFPLASRGPVSRSPMCSSTPTPFPTGPPLLISSHSLTWQRYKRARGCSHACLLVHSRSVDPCAHTLRAVLRLCLSADDTVAQFESCLRDVPCLHPEPSLVKCGSRWD